jgi:hypothetical protein
VTADQLHSIGGVITIVGSILFSAAWATSTLLGNPSVKDVEISRWLAVPAHILLLLGLVAVYLVQAHRGGAWGLGGFLLAFTGFAVFIGYVIGGWTAAIPEPRLGPVGGMMWLVGLLILAIVSWQSSVLPRWAGVLWFAGALAYASTVPAGPQDEPRVVSLLGALIFAAGFAIAGFGMFTEGR